MLETNVDGLLLLGVSMTYSSTVGNVDDNLDRGRDCLGETGYWRKLLLTPPTPCTSPPVTNTDVYMSPSFTNTDAYTSPPVTNTGACQSPTPCISPPVTNADVYICTHILVMMSPLADQVKASICPGVSINAYLRCHREK